MALFIQFKISPRQYANYYRQFKIKDKLCDVTVTDNKPQILSRVSRAAI